MLWILVNAIEREYFEAEMISDMIVGMAANNGPVINITQARAKLVDFFNNSTPMTDRSNGLVSKIGVMSASIYCCCPEGSTIEDKQQSLFLLLTQGDQEIRYKKCINGVWELNDYVVQVFRSLIEFASEHLQRYTGRLKATQEKITKRNGSIV